MIQPPKPSTFTPPSGSETYSQEHVAQNGPNEHKRKLATETPTGGSRDRQDGRVSVVVSARSRVVLPVFSVFRSVVTRKCKSLAVDWCVSIGGIGAQVRRIRGFERVRMVSFRVETSDWSCWYCFEGISEISGDKDRMLVEVVGKALE